MQVLAVPNVGLAEITVRARCQVLKVLKIRLLGLLRVLGVPKCLHSGGGREFRVKLLGGGSQGEPGAV